MKLDKKILRQVRALLHKEKFAVEDVLTDGRMITAEAFVAGEALYLIDTNGEISLAPAGEYATATTIMVVDDAGSITEVKEVKVEVVEETPAVEEEFEAVTLESVSAQLSELIARIEKLEEVKEVKAGEVIEPAAKKIEASAVELEDKPMTKAERLAKLRKQY